MDLCWGRVCLWCESFGLHLWQESLTRNAYYLFIVVSLWCCVGHSSFMAQVCHFRFCVTSRAFCVNWRNSQSGFSPLHVLKVAGDRREELRWERELEWRKKGTSGAPSQSSSPSAERRPFPEETSRHAPPPGKSETARDTSAGLTWLSSFQPRWARTKRRIRQRREWGREGSHASAGNTATTTK